MRISDWSSDVCSSDLGERRALPWVRIDKDYVFDAPEGRRSLADLFEGRRQLLVQHFMFGPGWKQGCPSCSFMADHSDGMTAHLAHRDVTLVRSEEHTSELQSLMRISYAVFCLKKKQ